MKEERSILNQTQHSSKSAAENVDSDLAMEAPNFLPTAQLKIDPTIQAKSNQPFQLSMMEEEEEELQMKQNPIQRESMEEEEEELQMKKNPIQRESMEEEEEELQMKENSGNAQATTSESASITQLPENVQGKMEASFGADFSNVDVYQNSSKAESLGAQAFTQGDEIHFASGKYSPQSQSGQELLGHEMAHVVQQREGRVSPTTQMKGAQINDDVTLEREADEMGAKASKGKKTKS